MFCFKCGAKVPDNAGFCPECGTKLVADSTPASTVENINNMALQTVNIPADSPKKKKWKKWPFILAAIALLAVVLIVIAILDGETDYVATAKAHKPFALSQDLPYTFAEVFDNYLDNPIWYIDSEDDENDTAIVKVDGTVKETEYRLIVAISVAPNPDDPDGCLISPQSAELNGIEAPSQDEAVGFLIDIFAAYEEGYEDLSDYLSGTEIYWQLWDVELTETYTNEEEGLSFKYPADWEIDEYARSIINIMDGKNTPEHRAWIDITNLLDIDVFGIFTDDTDSIKESVSDICTFLSLEDTEIDGVPARILKTSDEGLNGHDDITKRYYYIAGGDIYCITCTYTDYMADAYEKIFDAVIDSFQINLADDKSEEQSNDALSPDISYPIMYSGYTDGYSPCPVMLNEEDASGLLCGTYEEMMGSLVNDGVTMYAVPGMYGKNIYTATRWGAPVSEWYNGLLTYEQFLNAITIMSDAYEDYGIENFTCSAFGEDISALAGRWSGNGKEISISVYTDGTYYNIFDEIATISVGGQKGKAYLLGKDDDAVYVLCSIGDSNEWIVRWNINGKFDIWRASAGSPIKPGMGFECIERFKS